MPRVITAAPSLLGPSQDRSRHAKPLIGSLPGTLNNVPSLNEVVLSPASVVPNPMQTKAMPMHPLPALRPLNREQGGRCTWKDLHQQNSLSLVLVARRGSAIMPAKGVRSASARPVMSNIGSQ
jgi:hypothetical protein